jgi:succinate dehydrogenase hydrophobic anchor subunit
MYFWPWLAALLSSLVACFVFLAAAMLSNPGSKREKFMAYMCVSSFLVFLLLVYMSASIHGVTSK